MFEIFLLYLFLFPLFSYCLPRIILSTACCLVQLKVTTYTIYIYIYIYIDHPQTILKNIPPAVNRRISALSSSEEIFDSVAPLYQDALNKAGYNYTLKFDPETGTQNRKSRCRKRNILWFNPPYSSSVKTNVGAKILRLKLTNISLTQTL